MKFKIPFTFSSIDKLKKKSQNFKNIFHHVQNSKLQEHLDNNEVGLEREEYLGICAKGAVQNFIFMLILSGLILYFINVKEFAVLSPAISLAFVAFIFFIQLKYPSAYSSRKQRQIERNLTPALEDILVQLNSGIPLFTILVNISSSDYGVLSEEFRKAVRKINSGFPQVEVLEQMGEKNPSIYFRRAIWQISNGMRAGSDISVIIKESVKSLNEEQVLQIQNYGNKLNPVIMFYMIIGVILPALAITFLTIITSLVNLPENLTTLIFIVLGFLVVLLQVMFLGTIKSFRPSLT